MLPVGLPYRKELHDYIPRRIELSHNLEDELWPDIAIVENLFFLSLILCSLAKLNFCLGHLQPTRPMQCYTCVSCVPTKLSPENR